MIFKSKVFVFVICVLLFKCLYVIKIIEIKMFRCWSNSVGKCILVINFRVVNIVRRFMNG